MRHVKKSHSSSPGAPSRRGRVKTEPPAGPGSPGLPSAPPAAAAGAAAAAAAAAGGAVYVAGGGEVAYFSEEHEDVPEAAGGGGGPAFRPPSGGYQPPPPPPPPLADMDISDPALLSSFEPPEVLPDLGHTSADLGAVLRAESYAAACSMPEVFYGLPHPRLSEPLPLVRASEPPAHPLPELFPLTAPLTVRARLPPGGKDLAALMQSAMATSTLTLPSSAAAAAAELAGLPPPPPAGLAHRPTEGRRSPSPGQEYSAPLPPPPPHYRYYEEP